MADELQGLAQQILEIGPLVMRTVSAEMRQMDHFMMTSHFRLLWMLEHHSFTLSELAEHQMVSLPTMSNSITILEERGWVTRTRSTKDRRRVQIEITEEGRGILDEIRQHMEGKVSEIIRSLSADERERVSQGLHILRDAFITSSVFNERCPDREKK
ncbi:MAG: MarR family transcriptional regulator [Anaerolineae bacterium]|nr:MarR family transcriptional regulator [Anaerolineae bacterium]